MFTLKMNILLPFRFLQLRKLWGLLEKSAINKSDKFDK